jgi:hypothetical protein
VTSFAIQIDDHDGGTRHVFGSGEQALRVAEALRDGWRTQRSDDYYSLVIEGRPEQIFVRDIADVRVVVGGGR